MLGPPYRPRTYSGKDRSGSGRTTEQDVGRCRTDTGIARYPDRKGRGQRADPNFDTKVAQPAYGGDRHPAVLFDEAHHNFHTAGGRYKPFAELIASDGYQVIPNREKFSREVLQKGDILVIANASGPRAWASPARRIRRSPMPSATPSATGSRTAARSC